PPGVSVVVRLIFEEPTAESLKMTKSFGVKFAATPAFNQFVVLKSQSPLGVPFQTVVVNVTGSEAFPLAETTRLNVPGARLGGSVNSVESGRLPVIIEVLLQL